MSVRLRTPRLIAASTLAGAALLVALTGCVPAQLIGGGSTGGDAPATTAPEPEAPVEETAAPAATEVKGEVIKTETFENGLQVDVYVLGYGKSAKGSSWQNEDGEDAYPKGTDEVAVAFVFSNPTDAPLNIYSFSQTGAFEGSKYYATTDSDSTNATHILLGYDNAPYDTYGFDAEEWPLEPGDTAYYASSIYLDGDTLVTAFSVKATGSDDYLRIDEVELKFNA